MWEESENLLIYKKTGKHSDAVAAFDLDETIITTKSGKKFAKEITDWKFKNNVINKFKQLETIIIFTNQKKAVEDIKGLKNKIEDIINSLNHESEIWVFIAIGNSKFRKPSPLMWWELEKQMKISKKSSFFVGDAAGRLGDFADTDLKFAVNIGIPFYTPEQFFDGKEAPVLPYLNQMFQKSETEITVDQIISDEQEIIVMVGFPASGKTSFSRLLPSRYKIVSQDVLKTCEKCVKQAQLYVKQGFSVVIDNTNPTIDVRSYYVKLCPRVKCVEIVADFNQALHNNAFRFIKTGREIKNIVLRGFKSKYQPPQLVEGFTEIWRISVETEEMRNDPLYKMFLV